MNSALARRTALLVFAMALAYSNAFAAGEITLVDGNVSVSNTRGVWRIPAKGERIESGDTIVTGKDGEIHVQTDDSGFLAVRPNTQLKIDDYRANGNEDDNVALNLLRGTLRSITGWIGKINPKKYAIRTSTATIGIRGTDHEPMVIDEGPDAGSYDKVNSGGTTMDTPFGKIDIGPNQAGFVPKTGEAPKVLAAIPAAFQPTKNEGTIDKAKERVEKQSDEKLKAMQKENERKGGGKSGKPKLGDSEDSRKAISALQDLLNAYERGDTLYIRNRLDVSMIGFQKLMDDIARETNQCKQMRVNLFDTQIQAGPDVAAIQTRWEKRCILLPDFTPQLLTGHTTFLIYRGVNGWTLAGMTGNNPFTGGGTLATVALSVPAGTCNAINALNIATNLPTTVTVTDPDRAGSPNVTVTMITAAGDSDTFSVPASGSAGLFQLTALRYRKFTPVLLNSGSIEISPTGCPPCVCPNLTARYSDTSTTSGAQTVSTTSSIP